MSVASRRVDHAPRPPWPELAAAALLLTFEAAPWPLLDKLFFLAAGVCVQRPSHSYALGGAQMPLEARMVGIFGGFLLTVLYLWATGRQKGGSRWPRLGILLALVALVAVMGADGLNATAYDIGWPHLYAPDNRLRLATGLAAGVGLAGIVSPLFRSTVWADGAGASFGECRVLLGALVAQPLLYAATVSGWGPLLYPLSLFVTAGLVTTFTMLNATLVSAFIATPAQVRTWRAAAPLLAVGLALALGELALLAAGRQWLQAALQLPIP